MPDIDDECVDDDGDRIGVQFEETERHVLGSSREDEDAHGCCFDE